MTQKSKNALYFVLVCLFLLLGFIKLLGISAFILFLSFALAYITYPFLEFLQKKGFSKMVGVGLVFLSITSLIALLVFLVIPPIVYEVKLLIPNIPDITDKSIEKLSDIFSGFGINLDAINLKQEAKRFLTNTTFILPILDHLKSALFNSVNLVVAFISFLLIPLFYIYLLDHVDDLRNILLDLCPLSFKYVLKNFLRRCDRVLSGYFRGQGIVAICLTIWYTIGFSVIGLQFGLSLGFVAGILSAIPYIGAGIAILGSGLLFLSHFDGWGMGIGILIVITGAQILEGLFLSPKIVGDKVGLNPLQSMISIIIFANMLGIFGVLLALPLGGIFKIIFTDLSSWYKNSAWHE